MIEEVGRAADLPASWAGTAGAGELFLSPAWLALVERTADVPIRYLLARRSGAVVAAVPTALLDHTAPWPHGRPDTLLADSAAAGRPGAAELLAALHAELPTEVAAGVPAGQAAALPAGLPGDTAARLGLSLLPSLVCGGRHLGRTRILHPDGVSPADLGALIAGAEALAVRQGARSVCFLFVDEREVPLRQVLAGRGYRSHESAGYCWLPLPAGGFDGYLGGLSAHRRQRVRADRRRVAAAGVQLSVQPLTADLLPRLAELETELFARYGMAGWQPARSHRFLAEVLAGFGADAMVSLARADGDVRGFGLLLRRGRAWHAHRAGFDYRFQSRRKLPLYYEVLYHRPIEHAAAGTPPAEEIHYGIGSVEAKRSRGCRVSRQYAYLRPLGVR